jgi:hypothetical protein
MCHQSMSCQTGSGLAVEAVLKHSQSNGSARLLLLLIARHIDAGDPSPSKAMLCCEMNLDEVGVRRHINKLEQLQELQVAERGGFRGRNRYTIVLPLHHGRSERCRCDAAEDACDSTENPDENARGATMHGTRAELHGTRVNSPGVDSHPPRAESHGVNSQGVQSGTEVAHNVPAPGHAMMPLNPMNAMHDAWQGDDLRSDDVERSDVERSDLERDDSEEIAEALMAQQVSQRIAVRLARSNPQECLRQLQYLPYWRQIHEIRDSGAWLHDAITKAYGPPRNGPPRNAAPHNAPPRSCAGPPHSQGAPHQRHLHRGNSHQGALPPARVQGKVQLQATNKTRESAARQERIAPQGADTPQEISKSQEIHHRWEGQPICSIEGPSKAHRQGRVQAHRVQAHRVQAHRVQAHRVQAQPEVQRSSAGSRAKQPPQIALRALEETKAILGRIPTCHCTATRPGENAATLDTTKAHWICYSGQCRFRQEAQEASVSLPETVTDAARHGPLSPLTSLSETLSSGTWRYAESRRQ